MFAQDFDRVAWDCIHFLREFQTFPLEEIKERGIEVFEIDGSKIKGDEAKLLTEIAKVMKFPDYFGNNWDALDECLRDMSWLKANGYILIVNHSKDFWTDTTTAGMLVESWLFCAEDWAKENTPFHLVFVP